MSVVASSAARANVALQLEFLIRPTRRDSRMRFLLSIWTENPAQARLRGGKSRASALNYACGAARCVRSLIPGALSILKGAVPGRARGLGHMAPTYFRREPGIATPTAVAAPHVFSVVMAGHSRSKNGVASLA